MKDEMIAFASRLIATPSISGTEQAVADLYLVEMEKLGYDEVFRDDIGNVIGIVNGSENGPTIMFNSHLDHVSPGELDNWGGYDPYGGLIDLCRVDNADKTQTEMAQCIHGRGASDVKGGAAVQVYCGAILAKMKKQGLKLKGKFIFTGVVLEEPAEMVGMIHLIDKTFPQRGLAYDVMISSEATSLRLYCGHRGRVEFLATIYGKTSHASAPWLGINGIYKAMPFIAKIKDEIYPALPEFEGIGQSTITITNISCLPGALSIIPDKCILSIDRRLVPGETVEGAKRQLEQIIEELQAAETEFKADIKVRREQELSYTGMAYTAEKVMAPWLISPEHPVVVAAAQALVEMGQTPRYGYWDFGTDASKTAGIDRKPTIGYSPMQEQYAHTPDDKVRIDFMIKALEGNVAIFLKMTEAEGQIAAL